jgi:anti-sigma-K factor RskA
MIDERMEEQAALHVLGALSDAETLDFKRKLSADPELKNFVARLSTATGAIAGAVPSVEPPPQLRAKILARIGGQQKIISLPERKSGFAFWLPWSLAAGLAVLCLMLFAQDTSLHRQVDAQAQRINSLDQLAQSLSAATNDLQQTVLALQETNRLAGLKIAMLNSLLADAPKTVAVSLWDEGRQEGVFVVQNLKSLPADRDYQLWVLDNGTTPVDAGVFHVDKTGGGRVDFKTKQPIKIAGRFAVTEEVRGGVASPTLKNMVLASN